MRPIRLTLCAWGPYPEEVSIDFTKFTKGSVFLVTGPTGAGKTTIFDAISYALYGNVSGTNREKTTVRSDFATKDMDTFVELIFKHKGKTYKIYRTPKYDRPKKRGDGYTTSPETAVLTIEDEEPIASVNEVKNKIDEIMGINYVQFKQIAMIAQGEFLNLLYAKSDEKVNIFRNLFKTQIYDQMQKMLAEKSKKLESGMKEHTSRMDEAVASIDCGEYEQLKEQVHSENKNYEKILELLNTQIISSKNELDEHKQSFEKINEEYTTKHNQIMLSQELNRAIGELSQLKQTFEQLLSKKSAMDTTRIRLIQGKKAQIVETNERLLADAMRQETEWVQKVAKETEQFKKISNACVLFSKELQKVAPLEEKISEQNKKITWLESLLPLFDELRKKEEEKEQWVKELESSNSRIKDCEDALIKQKDEKQKLADAMKEYANVENAYGEAKLKIEQAKQTYQNLQTLLKQLQQMQEQEKELDQLQKQYLVEEKLLKLVKQQYEEKELLYRKATIGLAARYLKENEPCPVCGSLEHPKKAVIVHEVPDEMELNKEKERYEEQNKRYQEVYNKASAISFTLNSKKEEFDDRMKQLEITSNQQLFEEFTACKETSKQLIEEKRKLELLLGEKEKCDQLRIKNEKDLELCQQKLEEANKKHSMILREHDTCIGSIENMRLQLPKEYSVMADVKASLDIETKQLAMIKEEMDRILKQNEELQSKKAATQSLLEAHQKQLLVTQDLVKEKQEIYSMSYTDAGFLDEQEYKNAKLTFEEITLLEEQINAYEKEVTSIKERIHQLEERVQGKEVINITTLEEELESLKALRMKEQENIEMMNTRFVCNQKAYSSIKEKIEKVGKLFEEYGYVKDLSNTSKGLNNEKIVFEHYVLAAYFEDILIAANLRLSAMTNARYELMKVEKVSDQRTKDSLDLEVLDQYTGKRRSVKTLSGGESFKAALSLALGLSDVIQQNAGGIEIDTLFIDEGFGSLDSESLDQALKALMKLTGKNKLVGIISHVNELKERIDTQIVVDKDQKGSSVQVIC